MRVETLPLSEDGSVHLTVYLQEPSRELPLWRTRPAVLVLPGGGYQMTSDREAEPVALSFLAEGFHAFVLRYSVGPRATYPNPLCDLSRAIKLVRDNAAAWGVRPDRIAVCGFSAGGHLAAALGTLWNDPGVQAAAGVAGDDNQPNALLLGYPVISAVEDSRQVWFTNQVSDPADTSLIAKLSGELNVGPHTPPTFMFHTYQDNVVPVENTLLFARALALADVPFEMHIFQRGGHGLAMAKRTTASSKRDDDAAGVEHWFALATAWLWRLFDPPSGTSAGSRRAHFGDLSHGNADRYAETGRFTLDTCLGDLLDDARSRAVIQRYLPAMVDAATGPGRDYALRTIMQYVDDPPDDATAQSLADELAGISNAAH